jgi:NADPH2:quinone reductase
MKLILVKACGLNFQTLIIQGKYQFKPDLPFSPGEISGIIKEVGEQGNILKKEM